MKTFIAAAALATALVSPALAQTSQRHPVPQQYPSQYDQTVGRTEQPRPTTGHAVYDNNQYLGADPDPNVRLDLRRDYEGRDF